MSITEGDAIEPLIQYLKVNNMRLMTGRVSLRIQPRVLEQVAARIETLVQLQNTTMTAQAAAVSTAGKDIGGVKDILRLEVLQRLLSHVRWLRIESPLPGLRDPTGLRFAPFSGLRKLELRGCDLSTSAWESLPLLQESLVELHVTDTLEALHHLLAPHAVAVTPTAMSEMATWQQLRVLACSRNCIVDLDPSLMLLPALQSLTIVNSNISTVANLQACQQLTSLDLGHNRISSLTGLTKLRAVPLKQLSLGGNSLRSTEGIENLPQLHVLNLGFNYICSVAEIVRLSGLVALQSLQLAGNPLSFSLSYRCDALSAFSQCMSLKLDGAVANSHERRRLRKRAAGGRLNQICRPTKPPDGSACEHDRWQGLVDDMLGPLPMPRRRSLSKRTSSGGEQLGHHGTPRGTAEPEDLIEAFSLGWHGFSNEVSAARHVTLSATTEGRREVDRSRLQTTEKDQAVKTA